MVIKKIGLCALALITVCMLSSCKDTDALSEIIYNQSAPTVDYNNSNKIYQEADSSDPLDGMENRVLSETETQDMQEQQNDPDYSEDANTDQQTNDYQSADTTASDSEAAEGSTANSEGNDGNSSSGVESDSRTLTDSSDKTNSGTNALNNGGGNSSEDADNNNSDGDVGQVYDASDGTTSDLPTGTQKIAATGQYALIVQMLAGEGPLVAANEDFLTGKAGSVYSDEGIGDVIAAWSGDGDSYEQADIDELLSLAEQGELDCVLVGSDTSTLDQSQADQLTAAGVDVVTMPSATADDDSIVEAVEIVGTLLADAESQYDTESMAEKYVSQHDAAIAASLKANGGYAIPHDYPDDVAWKVLYKPGNYFFTGDATAYGYYSITDYVGNDENISYVVDWASATFSSVYYSGYSDEANGVGIMEMMFDYNPTAYYLQAGGVINYTTSWNLLYSRYTALGETGVRYQPVVASLDDNITSITAIGIDADYPNISDHDEAGVIGSSGAIAKTASIAENIQASSELPDGVYHLSTSYDVYVMPSGLMGSWGDGGVESFLMAPWVYAAFHDGDLSTSGSAYSYVENFCQTFYRCDASAVIEDFDSVYTCQ
jgi:hypothetical protein